MLPYLFNPLYKIQFKFIQTGPLQYFFGLNRLFVGSNEAHKNLSSPPNFLINVEINISAICLSGAPQNNGEKEEDETKDIGLLFLRS